MPAIRNKNETNQPDSNRRITIFIFVFAILLSIILVKLFSIQVVNATKYQLAAKKQYESKISIKPNRGLIFDRKMNALVSNVNLYSFAADPNMIDNKDSVAEVFSRIFKKEKKYYLDKLNEKNTSFVWLERRVDSKFDSQVKDLNLSGVIKINESNRVFNYDKLSAQIIGVTDIDDNGLSGMELEFNKFLAGSDGYVVMQKDGLGRKRPAPEYPRQEPVNGNNLVLTIDMNIQKIIEEELPNGIKVNNAIGGKCVVMSVKTGEILGMSSAGENGEIEYNRLSVISDVFEPGSTFKIVGASASLEEGIENKNDIIATHSGEYLYNGGLIQDAEKSGSDMSFAQVVEHSSNVGMITVVHKLGDERFYKYARDFGFGITTGVDFPGEMKGILKRPVEFSPVSLSFMAIGYEMLVTALQMTNAYACIANDGVLMKPYLVKKEISPDGITIKEYQPTPIRSVISKNTAKTMNELFIGVVELGTGKEARIEGVKVAGKTGTAQKLVDGQYSKSNYTSSFIGYFPADNPQIVVSVIIDAPGKGSYYGGAVAAPIFKKIAERIIDLTGLQEYSHPELSAGKVIYSDNTQNENESAENQNINLVHFEISDAIKILKEKKIEYEIEGVKKNAFVVSQENTTNEKGDKLLKLITGDNPNESGKSMKENAVQMPDLTGLSIRQCIKLISSLGVEFKVNGNGKVITQKPEAGAVLSKNQTIVINCGSIN